VPKTYTTQAEYLKAPTGRKRPESTFRYNIKTDSSGEIFNTSVGVKYKASSEHIKTHPAHPTSPHGGRKKVMDLHKQYKDPCGTIGLEGSKCRVES
jgi:hypothetical protein